MRRGAIDAAEADDPDALLDRYRTLLRETVDAVGVDRVEAESGLDRATIERAVGDEAGEVTLEEAASILASDPGAPDAESIAAEARDILLLGMTTAVLDVESLASELDGTMGAKALQQKVEGRHPMTLGEYAAVHYHLRDHTD
jgi:hypothetical protein